MRSDNSAKGLLGLRALNHISRLTTDLQASRAFYTKVLSFQEIRRPSFDFEGSWLYGYGIGMHLILSEHGSDSGPLDPKADHLSFTCDDFLDVERRLREAGILCVKQTVEELGQRVSQLFFKDPGGTGMIEICNCDCLPIILLDIQRTQSESAFDFSHQDWNQQQGYGLHPHCSARLKSASLDSGNSCEEVFAI